MTRAVSTVTSSRHPAAWGAFVSSLGVGFWGTVVPSGTSNAIDDALPDWFTWTYYLLLLGFGLAGSAALAVPELERRLRAERCCWYVGYFHGFYCIAAFANVGASAGQAAIFAGTFPLVATYRIVQITRELHALCRDQEKGQPAEPPPLGVAEEGTSTS